MPRVAHPDPPRRINVTLPESLVAELELRFFNPVTGAVQYGARSSLIAGLIRAWLDQTKGTSNVRTEPQPLNPSGSGGPASTPGETLPGGTPSSSPQVPLEDNDGAEANSGGIELRDLPTPGRSYDSGQFEFEESDEETGSNT